MKKKVIFGIFAGRQKYLSILKVYLDILLDKNVIDEVHIWDYIKHNKDRLYVQHLVDENGKYSLKIPLKNLRSWDGFYNYYYDHINENDILIKCDDDIVYIDTNKFETFVNSITEDYFYFPNIVNNDVLAYFQQQNNIHNLFDYNIPDINDRQYNYSNKWPLTNWYDTFNKAKSIHELFIENPNKFHLNDKELIHYKSRISINLFACKGTLIKKKFDNILNHDDEAYISSTSNVGNIINLNCTVVHFQFGPQNHGNNLDNSYLDKYKQLSTLLKNKSVKYDELSIKSEMLNEIINKCYNEILNRNVDDDGLKTYTEHLNKGKTEKWLRKILKNSDEYKNMKP